MFCSFAALQLHPSRQVKRTTTGFKGFGAGGSGFIFATCLNLPELPPWMHESEPLSAIPQAIPSDIEFRVGPKAGSCLGVWFRLRGTVQG